MRPQRLDWQALAGELAAKKRLLLFLDFDGTLAPIERTPREASLPEGTRDLMRRLAGHPGVDVVVISGRRVKDIRSKVRLPGVYLAGNHGLEIEGPGVSFCHPKALTLRPVLRGLARDLRRECRELAGVIVENKGLSVSIHYRRLPPGRVKELARLVRLRRERTAGLPVRWRTGHKVWEVLPDAGWDKGRAALLLLRRLREPFPIALGDDRTDEDMFRSLRAKGVTIRIGCPRPSLAQYCLASQRETARFLGRLEASLNGGAR
jgi:trehalose 6-phosphate phosphatase